MTLMDEPRPGATPHEVLLSKAARRDHPSVSLVIPVGKTSDVASTLERLPELDGEVILVGPRPTPADIAAARALRPDVRVAPATGAGDRSALRAGFAAARGDCIVVLDGDGGTTADDVERFIAALHAGCRSSHRIAA
jgi:cellulose synthase/poly-beta-1,6-N-acetylglucosamine synthase-like glycosyltransferase